MTTDHAPFQSAHHLPADLAVTFYLVTGAMAAALWTVTRPRLSRALTTLGARLA